MVSLFTASTPGTGSFWQVQTNLELISNLIDLGMPLQAAIDAPHWTMGGQTSWSDFSLNLEARFGGHRPFGTSSVIGY